MTGPSPDLAALREKAEAVLKTGAAWEVNGFSPVFEPAFTQATYEYDRASNALVMLAVLSLVEEQQKEIERLRTYVEAAEAWDSGRGMIDAASRLEAARVALGLAGSPAANKEPASAPWEGLEGWSVGVEFRGNDVVVMARAPGQSVWRDLLTVTR